MRDNRGHQQKLKAGSTFPSETIIISESFLYFLIENKLVYGTDGLRKDGNSSLSLSCNIILVNRLVITSRNHVAYSTCGPVQHLPVLRGAAG